MHCADRDAQGLHETATLIKDMGGTARIHHLDVTDRAQVRQAVAACERLDVMAAVAGIMHSSSVLETRDEDLDRRPGRQLQGRAVRLPGGGPR